MKVPLIYSVAVVFSLLSSLVSRGDQPVFNEMPRWDGGWGVQLVYEYRSEDQLLLKQERVGGDLTESVQILHVEGVYTWDKAVRMTVKVPYVIDAERELPSPSGTRTQEGEGLGDITVALPLKKYFNLSRRSGSWTFAPQLRIPTGGDDDYDVYDHEWGVGLSTGYEVETHRYIFAIGGGAWSFFGKEPFEASGSLDLGRNFEFDHFSGSLKWENNLAYENDGSTSFTYFAGPSLYLRLSDACHFRFSYKYDFYDRQGTLDHGRGQRTTAGIATVW